MNTDKEDILTRLRIEKSEAISSIRREQENTSVTYELSNAGAIIITTFGVGLMYFIIFML